MEGVLPTSETKRKDLRLGVDIENSEKIWGVGELLLRPQGFFCFVFCFDHMEGQDIGGG